MQAHKIATRLDVALSVLCAVLLAGAWPAMAQDNDGGRGRVLLQQHCARCHAIDAKGESPLKDAPPLRDIYERFAPRDLHAMLVAGMVSRHRDMPQVEMSPQDADAVMAYLFALAASR